MRTSRNSLQLRINLVMAVMGLVAGALVVQLIRVQFGPYAPVFSDRNKTLAGEREKVAPARGLIFDREGRLLATNSTQYFLEVDVLRLSEKSRTEMAIVLSQLLGISLEDITAQLNHDWISEEQFRIRLTREQEEGTWPITVDQYTADLLTSLLADPQAPDLSGLLLVRAPRRVYPADALAGHVLGFVNQEGEGFFAIEGYYDEWLAGKPITIERPLIAPEAHLQPDPASGVNLVLTIDADIQEMVESILKDAVRHSRAVGGQILIMDPRNGEILAMAAEPELNPNDYQGWLVDSGDEEPVIAPAVAGQYEPGSTFKVLTMAAALDAGVVTPDEEYIDTGEIEIGGHVIRNWDGQAWGQQTMVGCLEHSLNVCLAHVAAEELGTSLFYEYMDRFGIGQLTGVDLAGEVAGELRTPGHPDWTEADLGANSFGQGVSVTPLQLIAAVGAIANGGILYQPHLVREVVSAQGSYWPQPTVLGNPISRETAETLTEMLRQSVQEETNSAEVPGYALAGKTGTAQIATQMGYDPRFTIASFIGWGPLPDARFVVLVRLDKPRSSPWGSIVAAPVFQSVVKRLVVMMQIPPDSVRQVLAQGN
jgi:cell division protein FtsI/penicillin-binding protein 2